MRSGSYCEKAILDASLAQLISRLLTIRAHNTRLTLDKANAGVELYDHRGDDGTDFDAVENVNVAAQNPDVVAALSGQLHALVGSRASHESEP